MFFLRIESGHALLCHKSTMTYYTQQLIVFSKNLKSRPLAKNRHKEINKNSDLTFDLKIWIF